MTTSHNPEKYMAYRNKRGTPEHLWYKWYRKIWQSYPHHAHNGRLEPPSWMRDEFLRDVKYVVKVEMTMELLEKEGDKDDRR